MKVHLKLLITTLIIKHIKTSYSNPGVFFFARVRLLKSNILFV